jgi:TolB-like protein/DNA-binding winged helix-turn-helix (wHTH) protein/Tfp pilus assembly protein PilF
MPTGSPDGAMQIGEWLVDPALDLISRGAQIQKLEPRTMRLLMCLAECAGSVVSVDRLLTDVWSGVVVGSASVYQAVSQLRKLLGDTDPNPTYIATVPRKGYRLIAPVKRIEPVKGMQAVSPAVAPEFAPSTGAIAESPAVLPLQPIRRRNIKPLILGGAALAMLVAAGLLLWNGLRSSHRAADHAASIVVLPFIDLTTEKADQAFCDGLTEELSNWLAQIPTLRVVARTSAFAFRGQGEDVRKIGMALDTNHILEGSMRRSGNHMRITAQLIDARTGYHLWSQDFDRPVDDAIKIQEDVSRSVAGALQVRLTADSELQFAARRTKDPQAYQLFLLARHYAQQGTLESTDRAIDLFGQVLRADPQFAPAYVQLAYARLNRGYLRSVPIADVAAEMEPLIAAALRLDGRLSAAYAARGALRAAQSRTKEGLRDLNLAVSLNPSDMGAFAEIGRIQLADGRPREALTNYGRAAALDPLNATLQDQRCTALYDLAQYDEAAKACERAQVLQPTLATPADTLAWLAESQGRIDEALRWNATALQAEPNDDFNLYWTRATFYLAVGLVAPAREAVESGRSATKDEDQAAIALLRVVYREGGADALRAYLDSAQLERSPHAVALFEAAYARLLLGEAAAAKALIARAVVAPDRQTGFAEDPWYARGEGPIGNSYRIDLAAADAMLGDNAAARRESDAVIALLNRMMADGVERYGSYELRAKANALAGRSDEAMRDLRKAATLGWRRAWWATHEPYFAALRSRSDFQVLMTQVNRSNDQFMPALRAGL